MNNINRVRGKVSFQTQNTLRPKVLNPEIENTAIDKYERQNRDAQFDLIILDVCTSHGSISSTEDGGR